MDKGNDDRLYCAAAECARTSRNYVANRNGAQPITAGRCTRRIIGIECQGTPARTTRRRPGIETNSSIQRAVNRMHGACAPTVENRQQSMQERSVFQIGYSSIHLWLSGLFWPIWPATVTSVVEQSSRSRELACIHRQPSFAFRHRAAPAWKRERRGYPFERSTQVTRTRRDIGRTARHASPMQGHSQVDDKPPRCENIYVGQRQHRARCKG